VRVLPGTPAAAAGLDRGDRIVERDGRPLSEPRCKPLDEASALSREYGVWRDDDVERIELEVVDLVD
jgi:S1-C subfamily serine protease